MAALLLPALPYMALALFMPSQFRFVVEDASQRGTPLLWTAGAMLAYFVLLLAMLLGAKALDRATVIVAAVPLLAAVGAFLVGAGLTLALAAFALAIVLVVAALVLAVQRLQALNLPRRLQSVWPALMLGLLLFLGASAASYAAPIAAPRALGSAAILAVSLGMFALWICAMALKPRFALVSLAYCAIAVLLFDPNIHAVPSVKAAAAPRELNQTFAEWLGNRRDLDAYRSRKMPYPVIFVSSEGGGIYAAAHAYGTLSTIARSCPTFSQHVFAAVGVSGGAIGNALFAAAADPEQKAYAPCRASDRAIDPAPVITDHLSPVLARLLLLETLDRLLPGAWLDRDRAQILTDSFMAASADKAHSAAAITDSFDPAGARPAIIAVTTDRNTGNRMILSPFRSDGRFSAVEWWPGKSPFEEGPPRDDSVQISVLNAAGLSARFPWVTPTGLLRLSETESRVLADGGYFDNSGAETVTDLVDALKFTQNWNDYVDSVDAEQGASGAPTAAHCDQIGFRIVKNFHLGDGEGAEWGECEIPIFLVYFALASTSPAKKADTQPSFLSDPVAVLLQSRGSRGDNALDYADLYYCGGIYGVSGAECAAEPGSSLGMFRNDIAPVDWNLPLGWFMSAASFDAILEGTADAAYFDFRRTKKPADTETELMIYHLDPALYDEGASPTIGDLFSNYGP